MGRVDAAVRRFFFAEEPIDRVAWFRRGLAAWTAAYVIVQVPHLEELYCRPILREGHLDRWFGIAPPPYPVIAAIVAALLLALALVVAAVRTRAATIAAALAYAALFGLAASPPRAYGELAMVQWGLVALAPVGPPGTPAPRWAARLLMLQLSAVYCYAALAKLVEGPGWRDGQAVAVISRSEYAQHLLSAGVTLERGPLAVAIAWSTIALELIIGVGLWPARTRRPAAAALVLLHAGIAATMRISLLFHALMLVHLLLFFGPPALRRRAGGAS